MNIISYSFNFEAVLQVDLFIVRPYTELINVENFTYSFHSFIQFDFFLFNNLTRELCTIVTSQSSLFISVLCSFVDLSHSSYLVVLIIDKTGSGKA
mgnify:CR=1 FL=1